MLNPKQFFAQRRNAVSALKSSVSRTAGAHAFNLGHSGGQPSLEQHNPSNAFSPANNGFNSRPVDGLNAAANTARKAGLSDRRVNRIVKSTVKKGYRSGQTQRMQAAGAAQRKKEDPFYR